jgi:hypothetical protein
MEALNGPLEVGLRALLILEAAYPRPLDLGRLSLMDHALIHSGDFGGPESVLPAIPGRGSELGIKRERVEEGLQVMLRAELVNLVVDQNGISYMASDNATSFIELLEAELITDLRGRAAWVTSTYMNMSDTDVSALLAEYSSFDVEPRVGWGERLLPGAGDS